MSAYINKKTLSELDKYMTVMEVKTKEFGSQTVVAVDDLLYLPTEDVEPVVRCKNCFYRNAVGNCAHPKNVVLPIAYPMDFCSDGIQK